MTLERFLKSRLDKAKSKNGYRFLRYIVPDGIYVSVSDKGIKRPMINLSGNDYMGYAADRELRRLFEKEMSRFSEGEGRRFPFSAVSSRLLSGNDDAYRELEDLLAENYTRAAGVAKAALVYNSGYHANTGILPALTGKDDIIIADKFVHASLIDGFSKTRSKVIRYPHLDYGYLETVLKKYSDSGKRIFLVTESVFSMDGDVSDLKILTGLKEKYGCYIYLDEAHGVGVRGKCGLGVAEESDCLNQIDFLVGTFGKAFASLGAYVICSETVRDYLINVSRTFIFTTALPPFQLKWSTFVLKNSLNDTARRVQLKNHTDYLRREFNKLPTGFTETAGSSHIVPLILGNNDKAVAFAKELQQNGYYALPVRAPAVPEGTARVRFSLNAALSFSHIKDLALNIKAAAKGYKRLYDRH